MVLFLTQLDQNITSSTALCVLASGLVLNFLTVSSERQPNKVKSKLVLMKTITAPEWNVVANTSITKNAVGRILLGLHQWIG